MPTYVRQALLDDTQAISALFRARVSVWQRLDADGRVETVPYEALTIYERWLHGGAWMSIETGALQLSHLLRGAGIALVAGITRKNGSSEPLAYAEAYHGIEPNPFGAHVHLGHLVVHPDHADAGLDAALIADLLDKVKALKCQHLTVNSAADSPIFQTVYELTPLARVRRFSLSARTGQVFYKAVEHLNADAAQIQGWHMSTGRVSSARQQWENLWQRQWEALPEIRAQRVHRLKFNAAGQEAIIFCREHLYDPRSVEISSWSLRPLTPQSLTALRDWAYRENYRTLVLTVTEDIIKALGTDAEADGYVQETYTVSRREE